MKKLFNGVIGLSASVLFLASQAAVASLVSSTGSILITDAPASVAANVQESTTSIIAFEEQQDFTLTIDLAVDELVGTGTGGVISAGTVVNSHFLHFDPVGTCGLDACLVDLSGSLAFGEIIVGLIWTGVQSEAAPATGELLDASDYLGAPGTFYETGALGRGYEIGEFFEQKNRFDIISVGADGKTLDYVFNEASELRQDQLRVITVTQVPVPGAFVLMLSALGALTSRKLFSRK